MSYYLVDGNSEMVGQVGSGTGLADMTEWVGKHGGQALHEFLQLGASLLTDELFQDLDEAVKVDAPKDIHDTLVNLRRLVGQSDIIVIITNGYQGG